MFVRYSHVDANQYSRTGRRSDSREYRVRCVVFFLKGLKGQDGQDDLRCGDLLPGVIQLLFRKKKRLLGPEGSFLQLVVLLLKGRRVLVE